MAYLIGKVEALEKALLEKNETPTPPVDRWLNIDELKAYYLWMGKQTRNPI